MKAFVFATLGKIPVVIQLALLLLGCSHQKYIPQQDLSILPESASVESPGFSHVAYMIQTGRIQHAIDTLLQSQNTYLRHSDILQILGMNLLQTGIHSSNNEAILFSLYGAGISCNERVVPIVRNVLLSDDPYLQLTAINVLHSLNTDDANNALIDGMKSDFPIVRLEAAYCLAIKKHTSAFDQIQALAPKLPQELRFFLPQLFAIENSHASQHEIERLLHDTNEQVRIEAILALAATQQIFVDNLKTLINDPSPAIQEAVASVLGASNDESAIELLKKMPPSLATSFALLQLGEETGLAFIEEQARNNDLFAITLLGKIPQANATLLHEKVESSDIAVSVNATRALLERRDRFALIGLPSILLHDHKDLAFQPLSSIGRTMRAWRVIPSARQNLPMEPFLWELSLRMQEEALIASLELPEPDFLEVAAMIFDAHERPLLPLLTRLLENLKSPAAIELLKEQEQRPGAPSIRAWCNLALFRLHEPGPWAEHVRQWVEDSPKSFQQRPMIPWQMTAEPDTHSLTLEEQSALLVESFAALAQTQDVEGINILLQALKDTEKPSCYTLSGLLMRASN